MNNDPQNHDDLRQQMAHASLLSPDDPQREAVVQRVREAGEAMQAEWAAMLEENERLRLMS